MTLYAFRDRTSGRYPITLAEVRSNVNMLFGDQPTVEVLDEANVDPVLVADPPAHDAETHYVEETAPISDGGIWRQAWVVIARPLPEAVPAFVYKIDLFERTTNAEAEAILSAMDEQPARVRMIFNAAQSFREDHELWPLLTGAAIQLFGAERAAVLLAPSA